MAKEIVHKTGGSGSELTAPGVSRVEALEPALGKTGGNRKYCVT